jgi:hypothetical protein
MKADFMIILWSNIDPERQPADKTNTGFSDERLEI